MTSLVNIKKKCILKKRSLSQLNVKIEATPKENILATETIGSYSEQKNGNDSFFYSIWPVLAVAQYMGFMPIDGIRTGDPSKFIFHWKTIRMIITLFYLVLGGFVTTTYFRQLVAVGMNAKNIVGLIFFSTCLFCGILFLSLAQKWKALAVTWSKCEQIFLNLPYKECGWRLSTKIRITAAIIWFFASLEHLMSLVSGIYNYAMRVRNCNIKIDDEWKHFFLNEHRHIFQVLPYNFLITILIEWVNITFTFGWNYMDTVIIITSIGLATRFQQINQRLETIKNEAMNEFFWSEIRQHYLVLCELVELVDENLASIILLCCTNNLYFICFQLLNIFNKLPYLINYVYFWYSLLYLICRTTAVFLIASSVNDAAKYPLKFVRQRQTSEWCIELERFGDQISTEVVALSGMKFFFITRSLLFGMAGTIVTYELVLLQFYAEEKNYGNVTICDVV